ncbi:uncharacterized protein LOC131936288 isoform X2 [Physella acuta]|uniref:uncharacterized protein LOC131936288 isoform X2 n=1 Tax=Physella acuta TaxID=109671 RepID=UPI0027DCECAC|nr:uncharacterized protein LOC131936288 isoform X2 [Physella acuta]
MAINNDIKNTVIKLGEKLRELASYKVDYISIATTVPLTEDLINQRRNLGNKSTEWRTRSRAAEQKGGGVTWPRCS